MTEFFVFGLQSNCNMNKLCCLDFDLLIVQKLVNLKITFLLFLRNKKVAMYV